MSATTAVPNEWLRKANLSVSGTGRPLCPQCKVGYLHPYLVEIGLSWNGLAWNDADYLVGWAAVCAGNADDVQQRVALFEANDDDPGDEVVHPPCGFAMPMQAKRRARPAAAR